MSNNVEIKKVDSQGRIVLPSDWRDSDLKYSNEVYIIKEPGCLKIIPKKKVDLTKFFDKVDFDIEDEVFEEDWKTIKGNLLQRKVFKSQ
jgi:bifunctional DNA-binding transcriptional regulator/antitoxin component of YhaV-PrlF toxin-antitoxin module